MVATALMMLSTLGFEIVEPMYIEFIVDDLRISKSSSSSLIPVVRGSIFKKLCNLNNIYYGLSTQYEHVCNLN